MTSELHKLITMAVLVVVSMLARHAQCQTPWYEGFEGPQVSWQRAESNAQYRVDLHSRTQSEAHTGSGCERVSVSGSGGTYIYMAHDVGRPRVIEELLPTVWVKSDRPGLQILARVVLPRTEDPRTGTPVSTLVRGSSYSKVGHWQQLRIDSVPHLLSRQVRILRTQLGPSVDPREAYIDRVLLNVYGGPGRTNVWIDDLDIGGYVGASDALASGNQGWKSSSGSMEPVVPAPFIGSNRGNTTQSDHVKLVGSVLIADGHPIFPRAIQYQGERLARLKALGFNTVWLPQTASDALLEEAQQTGVWLICPPPQQMKLNADNEPTNAQEKIDSKFGPVLVWDVGWGLFEDQVPYIRQWARQVRSADQHQGRPLICRPDSNLRAYSRCVDLLMIGRAPLGTSLELTDYGRWIRERPRLARPGTPIWTTVQTQIAKGVQRQWEVAGGLSQSLPPMVGSEQIRLLTYMSIASGSRGLLFESHSSLDAPDPITQHRAAALELLNLELELIRPWLAAGEYVTTIRGSEPEVVGALFRTDRARLLVPIWSGQRAQLVPGQSAAYNVSFLVPGVPESHNAYEVTPGGIRPVRHKRVAGGIRIVLDEFGLTSLVLLTQDPLATTTLSRRSTKIGRRAAELCRHLALWKLDRLEKIDRQLASNKAVWKLGGELNAARKNVQWSDGLFARGDYRAAYKHAQNAMRTMRLLERAAWHTAVKSINSPTAGPATISFSTLPWHWRLADQINRSTAGGNRLSAGDFEHLETMRASGWRHLQHPAPGVKTETSLTPEAAHSGRFGLRIAAMPSEPEAPPTLVETPPVWVTTPPIPVEPGTLVAIRGWVQVPTTITGSVDGLLIVDSLSGECLAERIGETAGWQQFTLYRMSPSSGEMTVTFALSGLGEAWLDDITIQTLHPSAANSTTRLPHPHRAR